MDIGADLLPILGDLPRIRSDIEFARALRQLTIITVSGEIRPQLSPGAKNIIIDLRALTANGEVPTGGLPSQTGNSGKFLSTDGATAAWSEAGATRFTSVSVTAQPMNAGGASLTAMSFSTAAFNPTPAVWSAGAPTRLTVPEGSSGLFMGVCSLTYATNDGNRTILARKNGTDSIMVGNQSATSGGFTTIQSITFIASLAAADYVELLGYQTNSTSGALLVDGTFQLCRIGATP